MLFCTDETTKKHAWVTTCLFCTGWNELFFWTVSCWHSITLFCEAEQCLLTIMRLTNYTVTARSQEATDCMTVLHLTWRDELHRKYHERMECYKTNSQRYWGFADSWNKPIFNILVDKFPKLKIEPMEKRYLLLEPSLNDIFLMTGTVKTKFHLNIHSSKTAFLLNKTY